MKELSTKHRTVARYLALGISIQEICQMYGLSLSAWKQIVGTPLFKQEIARIQEKLEDRLVEDSVSDPVLLKLKVAAGKAADRLVSELDSVGEDSNSSSRIKAATSILDRLGYGDKKEEKKTDSMIFVALSSSKLASILGKTELAVQPASIQG